MRRRGLVPLGGLAATAALLLLPLPRDWRAGWRGELLDFGHVPLFAAFTLALWAWLRPSILKPVAIAVAVAGLAEVVQHFVGRTASWADWLNGSLGALAAGAVLTARESRRWHRLGWLAVAVVLVAWPVWEIAPTLRDAADGDRDFPTLAHFRTDRELRRWETRQADLVREPDPDRPGEWCGRVTFRPGPEDYPSVVLKPVRRDFRDYRRLRVEFAVEGGPLDLYFSVRGGPDESGHTTHYQAGGRFGPGPHAARIDLPAAAPLAQPRPLDLSDVWFVQLFTPRPDAPRTVRVRRVALEN